MRTAKSSSASPSVAEAERFIAQAETRLLDLRIKANRASWEAENFITDDTETLTAERRAGAKSRYDRACESGEEIWQSAVAAGRRPQIKTLEIVGGYSRAARSGGTGGAFQNRGVARCRLRQGQMVPARKQR